MKMNIKDWSQTKDYEPYEDEDLILSSAYRPDELMQAFNSPLTKEAQKCLAFQALCVQLYNASFMTNRKKYDTKSIIRFLQANKQFFDQCNVPDYIMKRIHKMN